MIRVTVLTLSVFTAAIVSAHALAPQVMPAPDAGAHARLSVAARADMPRLSLPLRQLSAEEARRAAPHAATVLDGGEGAGDEALTPTDAAPRPVR